MNRGQVKIYPPQERTIGAVLAEKAARLGPKTFLETVDGRTWSYAELDRVTNGYAEGFAAKGIGRGDAVAFVMGNEPELLLALWALGKLGAVGVPLNTAAKADQLVYLLTQSDSVLVCTDPGREDRVRAAISVIGSLGDRSEPDVLTLEGLQALATSNAAAPAQMHEIGPGDPHLIMFTSGTTGPSKGVVSPQSQGHVVGMEMAKHCGYSADDRLYTCLPVFHANALWFTIYAALWADATVVLSHGFSARRFWQEVRETSATQFNALGAMANIIWQLPPSELDRQHDVRTSMIVPLSTDLAARFATRYGIQVTSVYAMTENTALTVLGVDDPVEKASSAGRVRESVDVRIVDDGGLPVAVGTVGEIWIRTNEPGAFMLGYYRMPVETVEVTADLWFHTGDRGRLDEDGFLFFSDRLKEAIRRRGENISAYEVEVVLCQHPAVQEAAAVPVPSELGEDDVMVYVVPDPGADVDFADLVEFCADRMAYYMVPRYFEVVAELPKTASQKIEKYKLMQDATAALGRLWDREAAGVEVRR